LKGGLARGKKHDTNCCAGRESKSGGIIFFGSKNERFAKPEQEMPKKRILKGRRRQLQRLIWKKNGEKGPEKKTLFDREEGEKRAPL